ncbi:MAG: oligosaccharide flippase family protein [Spirochaetes bacterium]|nr:oligosaccharide flippase family protein [Spirochaetota bacterium]
MADSLKKRYFYKILTNIINLLFNIITASIIPRALGPEIYGYFSYIQNFFSRIIGFFDSGLTSAFYNKITKRQKEYSLITFYLITSFVVLVLLSLTIFLFTKMQLNKFIFPEHSKTIIFLGLVWGILFYIQKMCINITDAYGLTVKAEIVRMIIRVFAVLLLLSFFLLSYLNIVSYFIYHYFVFLSFIIISIIIFIKNNSPIRITNWYLPNRKWQGYLLEFYQFSHPLLTFQFFIMISAIFERWMLQKIAGSLEQGFFGFSYKISQICFLFSASLSPIFTRELILAFSNKNIAKMIALFHRYVPVLFSITAYFSCFLAINSYNAILLIGGSQYKGAYVSMIILSLLPIFQSFNQLAGSVFMATENTKLLRNIRIIQNLFGLLLTYFFIAPKSMFGLELNSTGLALKFLILKIITTYVYLYFISRILTSNFGKYFFHQLFIIIVFSFVALVSKFLVDQFAASLLLAFLLSGIIYSLLLSVLLYLVPNLFGLQRNDIQNILHSIKVRISLKRKK